MQNHQDDVSTADAAKRLGLGEDAIRKRIKRGVLKGYKRDNKWYVVLDDLDRIEQDSGRVPPRTSAKLLSHLEAEIAFLRTELREQRILAEQQLREKDQQLKELLSDDAAWREQVRYKELQLARLEDRLLELPSPKPQEQGTDRSQRSEEERNSLLSRFWHWVIGK